MAAREKTKATLAIHVTGIALIALRAADDLADGMWNPLFCSDDGTDTARRIVTELKERIIAMERAFELE